MRFTLAAILLLCGSASGFAAEPQRFEFSEPHMGTTFRLVFWTTEKMIAEKAQRAAFDRVAELNRIMSDYSKDSELMKLCASFAAEVGHPVKVSEELFFVLSKAQEVSALSEGAFDVTVGPVVRLWRVARKKGELPPAAELATALKKVGWQNVELNPKEKTVRLKVPGMLLDLGGIAKGYAADEGLRILAEHGIRQAMVAASGDIAMGDAPPDATGWKLEIGPLTRKSDRRILLLKNAAVSTSGDAEQFVEIGGVRYSHIVDPRTGLGLIGRQNVTVVAPKGISADSLTKMASIFPADKAFAIIERQPGTACAIARLKAKEEEIFQSPGFGKLLLKP